MGEEIQTNLSFSPLLFFSFFSSERLHHRVEKQVVNCGEEGRERERQKRDGLLTLAGFVFTLVLGKVHS